MKMKRLSKPSRAGFRRRRGFTLVEVMVATVIMTMIMIMVVGLQLASARAIKDMYNKTRTRASQMRALDQIRYRLMNASISSIEVADGDDDLGYREIQFVDPYLGGVVSRYFFDADADILYFDDDMADGLDTAGGFDDGNDDVEGLAVAEGPIDVRFFPLNFNATIRLNIKSEAYVTAHEDGIDTETEAVTYSVIDEQEGETTIWLRNS